MSTAKFEKLIDLIINEDRDRAEQLFHEIVVEKSRGIYESLMAEDDDVGSLLDEIESEESGHVMEEDDELDIEVDAEDDLGGDDLGDEDLGDEDLVDDDLGGDVDLGDDDLGGDVDLGDDDLDTETEAPASKEDIMNLEDKLDELMAEFEALMSKDDDFETSSEEEEEGEEEEEEEGGVMESVEMKKIPHPKGEDHKAASPVAKNSGQTGMASKPVKFSGSGDEKGRAAPAVKPLGMKFKNSPGGGSNVDQGENAPKPKHETIKAKSPVPESKNTKKKILK
jgi:hypothetical protein